MGWFETRWQQHWLNTGAFRAENPGSPRFDAARPKYYILDMFPYPSGAGLHIGHPEGYTATDILSRMKRMQGFNVLHPMGFDSFGLPAEQYAIETGKDPRDTTRDNIETYKKQFNKVCAYIKEGKETPNVDLITGGLPPTTGSLSQGYFLQPTVFSCNSNNWKLAREEIFGPVLMAIPWRNEEDVIRMANDTHFGLAGFVFSKDTGRAIRIAHQLDAGWVQVNQGKGQSYGGFKQSGIGKEFSLDSMIDSYSRLKSVTVNLGS